jgi:hypothetical protein
MYPLIRITLLAATTFVGAVAFVNAVAPTGAVTLDLAVPATACALGRDRPSSCARASKAEASPIDNRPSAALNLSRRP